jgi:hypothetical protein
MGSYSYNTTGVVQDINNIITNISPDETPLLTLFGIGKKARDVQVSSLTDSLPQPQNKPVVEGADYKPEEVSDRERIDNYVQIFDRPYFITDTQEEIEKFGVSDEELYQADKAMKAIALDLEYVIVTSEKAVKMARDVPGQMGGIPYFNTVNVKDMANAPLDEESFNDTAIMAWEKGGVPRIAVMSMKHKRRVNKFTGGSQKTRGQETKKAIEPLEFYESDAGLIKFLPHRMIKAVDKDKKTLSCRIEILDPQYFKVRPLINFHKEEIGKKGHRIEKAITGQMTMDCKSKDAQACLLNVA